MGYASLKAANSRRKDIRSSGDAQLLLVVDDRQKGVPLHDGRSIGLRRRLSR